MPLKPLRPRSPRSCEKWLRLLELAFQSLKTEQTSAAVATDDSNPVSPAERYFGDVLLTNQDGKQLRLYTDILKGNVVIINSFYSTCSGVCRVTIPVFKQLQDDLGERVGKDVRLVSITVDPESDTPEVLKQLRRRRRSETGLGFLNRRQADGRSGSLQARLVHGGQRRTFQHLYCWERTDRFMEESARNSATL